MSVREAATQTLRTVVPRPLRNWARAPRTTARWLWAEGRYATGRLETVEIRPGWRLRCHPAAFPFAYRSQIVDAEQAAELDSFISCCRPGMGLIDVGAHFGLFSLAALHFGGAGARAVAVDPSPTATRMIEIQASLNGCGERLRVLRAAVGERTGKQAMLAAGVMSAGYYVMPTKVRPRAELSAVNAITLDDLAAALDFRATHVKVDVEGAEELVFRGGRRVLSGPDAPLLFVELHNRIVRESGRSAEAPLELLSDFGYSFFGRRGEPPERKELLTPEVVRMIAAKPGHGDIVAGLSAS